MKTILPKTYEATAVSTVSSLVILIASILTLSWFTPASAQLRASSGLDLSLQAGLDVGLGNLHSGSFDASLTGLLPVTTAFDLVAGIGYQKVGQTDNSASGVSGNEGSSTTITNIPIFAGLRYNFALLTVMPYFGGEFSLNDVVYHTTNGVQSIPDAANTRIGYAIVLGTRIPISQTWAGDVTLKYHDLPTSGSYADARFLSLTAGLVVHLDI